MNYKLTIESDSLDDLYWVVSNLRNKATVVMQSEEQEAPKKTRKSKVTEEKPAELVKNEKPTETEEVSYDEVKKATLNLISKKGKPAALELLEQFGAASAPDLKPEQFLEYVVNANNLSGRL